MSAKRGRRSLMPRVWSALSDETAMNIEDVAYGAGVCIETARKHVAELRRRGLVAELPAPTRGNVYRKRARST